MNPERRKTRRILTLGMRYYDLMDKAAPILEEAKKAKRELLELADAGRYNGYTVYEVEQAKILVREHTRRSFRGLRRTVKGKENH